MKNLPKTKVNIMNTTEETKDLFYNVYKVIDGMRISFEEEELYEDCALSKQWMDSLSDAMLGYEPKIDPWIICYGICATQGKPVDAYHFDDKTMALFELDGLHYEFEMLDLKEWNRLRKQIKDDKK